MSTARRKDTPLGPEISVARMRYHGAGPLKVRQVADLLRGLTVEEAFRQLSVLHRPSGVPIMTKLLKSAVSNAKQAEYEEDVNDLIVGRILVDGGPMIKRFRPMGMGRGGRIRKRTCHVKVALHAAAE